MSFLLARTLHRLCSTHAPRDETVKGPAPPFAGDDRVRVAPSLVAGAGLGGFAARDIAEGETVCEYRGTVLSTLQVLRTPDWTYVMGLGRDRRWRLVWVDARGDLRIAARYVNHAAPERCNLRVERLPDEGCARLVAVRGIRCGEELLYDYGPRYWVVTGRRPS